MLGILKKCSRDFLLYLGYLLYIGTTRRSPKEPFMSLASHNSSIVGRLFRLLVSCSQYLEYLVEKHSKVNLAG